jgi:nicotinamide-nucleotide adenylyltransferase
MDTVLAPSRGIYIGRFSPFHNGHLDIVRSMVENHGVDNSIVYIGSCNSKPSYRNIFSYEQRLNYTKIAIKNDGGINNMKILGIPDFSNDDTWINHILSVSKYIFNSEGNTIKNDQFIFYGGSTEDLSCLIDRGLNVKIYNRYSKSLKTSASEIRDDLLQGRDIAHKVPYGIIDHVKNDFKIRFDHYIRNL